jgi:hypothetical protein
MEDMPLPGMLQIPRYRFYWIWADKIYSQYAEYPDNRPIESLTYNMISSTLDFYLPASPRRW